MRQRLRGQAKNFRACGGLSPTSRRLIFHFSFLPSFLAQLICLKLIFPSPRGSFPDPCLRPVAARKIRIDTNLGLSPTLVGRYIGLEIYISAYSAHFGLPRRRQQRFRHPIVLSAGDETQLLAMIVARKFTLHQPVLSRLQNDIIHSLVVFSERS